MNADSGYVDCLGHVEGRDFLENGSCEIGTSKVGVLKLTASQITVLGKKSISSITTAGEGRGKRGERERANKYEMWAVTAVRVYNKREAIFSVWSTLAE